MSSKRLNNILSFLRHTFVSIVILIYSSSLIASNCLYLALADFSARADVERTAKAKEFWRTYKSDPRFANYLFNEIIIRRLSDEYFDQLFGFTDINKLNTIRDDLFNILVS